ncbi:MAG: nucleotidyltransferase family protein [Terracidiphilus sp.]
MPVSVAAIIVAAGSSSRLGQPKQLVSIDGEPLLQRAIRRVQESAASPVFVVIGAHREQIESAIDFGTAAIVVNEDWAEGLASSIRVGVMAAEKGAADATGLLLMACDQPRVTVDHLRRMIEKFETRTESILIASTYAGVRGIPAIFPREAHRELLALRGDKGARALLQKPLWHGIEVPLEGGEIDIDSPDDLARIR